MKLSIATKSERLRDARRKLQNARKENSRLRAYIEALEAMAVRSIGLNPAQFKSALRRRKNLNLEKAA